jgi:hypothetical protein
MKKQAFLSTICTIIALFLMSNSTFAQSTESGKKVKIYLKNNSWLPKGVGIKEVKPDASVNTSYTGMWMPLATKIWEVQVGTRLEYIADKSMIMSGNASAVKGKLIVAVKAEDEGKTFSF